MVCDPPLLLLKLKCPKRPLSVDQCTTWPFKNFAAVNPNFELNSFIPFSDFHDLWF